MRPLCQAHPRRWSEAPAGDLRCLRDGSRRDPRARRPQEGAAHGEGSGKKQAAAKKTAASKAAAKKRATPAATGAAAKATRAPRRAATPSGGNPPAGSGTHEHVYDVAVVGAGPSGSACAYWLAEAGWDVVVVEKKQFPREKTCGDGLTPRAVRQLADMDLEGALAGSHRYSGLRAFGFGRSIDMRWPEHPNFPELRLHDHPPRPRRAGGRAR